MTTGPGPPARPRRSAILVVAMLAGAGAVVGVLWAWLAPPAHAVVGLTKGGERVHAYLGTEADHFFVAAVLMLGMLAVVAVVGSVLAWQWRSRRGPAMVIALSVGMAAAAGIATGVGSLLARLRYGPVDIDAAPVSAQHRVHYLTEATSVFFGSAPLQIAVTVLVPVAVVAFGYALMTVAAQSDDLGVNRLGPVTAAGGPPSDR